MTDLTLLVLVYINVSDLYTKERHNYFILYREITITYILFIQMKFLERLYRLFLVF